MTAKEKGMWHNWLRATEETIWDAYEKPSYNKVKAYHKCKGQMDEVKDAGNFRITGHNCNTFTCAFTYTGNNAESRMRYFTRYNTYDFEINLNELR